MSKNNLPNAEEVELEVTNELKFMLPSIRKIAIGVTILVLIGAGISKYLANKRQEKALAQQELALAGKDVTKLQKVVDNTDFPNELRAFACLRMGTAQFQANKIEEATTSFEKIVKDFPETTSTIKAMFGHAKCLEKDMDTIEKAITVYMDIAKKSSDDKFEALYAAARCHKLATQVKEAKKLYTEITKTADKNSPYKRFSEEQLLNLNAVTAKAPLVPMNMEKIAPPAAKTK